MKKATPEQQKAGMDAWMSWSKKASGTIADMVFSEAGPIVWARDSHAVPSGRARPGRACGGANATSASALRSARQAQLQQIRAEALYALSQLRHGQRRRRMFLGERDDIQQILPPLARTAPRLFRSRQLQNQQVTSGGEAKLKATRVDGARTRDGQFDPDVFRGKLDGGSLLARR